MKNIYVAVICKEETLIKGYPTMNGSRAFMSFKRDSAIQKAIENKHKWEENGNGPYNVYVGVIDCKAVIQPSFTLEPL